VTRTRLALFLELDEPVRTEVDAFRRGLGADVGRLPPHVTVLPPFNVNDEDLPDVLARVRSIASGTSPFAAEVGRVGTFLPRTAVAFLQLDPVGGDAVAALHERTLAAFPGRQARRSFVPHVTLAGHVSDDDVAAARRVMGGYRRQVRFDRITAFRQEADQRWLPYADVALGPAVVAQRGGLSFEIWRSTTTDPLERELLEGQEPVGDVVLTARRDGHVVGVAIGASSGPVLVVRWLRASISARGQGIGSHLLAQLLALGAEAGARWAVDDASCPIVTAFLGRHGFVDGVRRL